MRGQRSPILEAMVLGYQTMVQRYHGTVLLTQRVVDPPTRVHATIRALAHLGQRGEGSSVWGRTVPGTVPQHPPVGHRPGRHEHRVERAPRPHSAGDRQAPAL